MNDEKGCRHWIRRPGLCVSSSEGLSPQPRPRDELRSGPDYFSTFIDTFLINMSSCSLAIDITFVTGYVGMFLDIIIFLLGATVFDSDQITTAYRSISRSGSLHSCWL